MRVQKNGRSDLISLGRTDQIFLSKGKTATHKTQSEATSRVLSPKQKTPPPPPTKQSEHVAGHRAPGGHGRAAGPGGSEVLPPIYRLLHAPRRRARGAGCGVLVAAAEEGDQAPHEDAAQEDAAVGHQAPPHAVPAAAEAPSGLDSRRLQRHRRRRAGAGPRPRVSRGRRPRRR